MKKPPEPPQPRQKTSIQWTLTQPHHTMCDLILSPTTRTQMLDVISYFQNQDLLFHQWGLEERFSLQSGLAVNLYGPPGLERPLPLTPSRTRWGGL